MTSSRVTKGFYINEAGQQQKSLGFLTKDSWTDPVIKSTVTWVGYTFFELPRTPEDLYSAGAHSVVHAGAC